MKNFYRGGVAVLATLVIHSAITDEAQGSVVIFNSQEGYELVAPTFGLSTSDYELDTYSGFYSTISGGQDESAWAIAATSGVQGSFGEWVTSDSYGEALHINFQSDSVYSVGGNFHVINEQDESISGIMRLTLSDGTTYFNQLEGEGTFAAFLSTEMNITSLSVYAFNAGELESAGLSMLNVGVIPAPATVLAFSFGAAFRRRRS